MNYIAKITGPHKTYRLNRVFVDMGEINKGSNKKDILYDGRGDSARPDINWDKLEDGIYEIRFGSRDQYKKIYIVTSGTYKEVKADRADWDELSSIANDLIKTKTETKTELHDEAGDMPHSEAEPDLLSKEAAKKGLAENARMRNISDEEISDHKENIKKAETILKIVNEGGDSMVNKIAEFTGVSADQAAAFATQGSIAFMQKLADESRRKLKAAGIEV